MRARRTRAAHVELTSCSDAVASDRPVLAGSTHSRRSPKAAGAGSADYAERLLTGAAATSHFRPEPAARERLPLCLPLASLFHRSNDPCRCLDRRPSSIGKLTCNTAVAPSCNAVVGRIHCASANTCVGSFCAYRPVRARHPAVSRTEDDAHGHLALEGSHRGQPRCP